MLIAAIVYLVFIDALTYLYVSSLGLSAILEIFHLKDAHHPMLGRIGLFQLRQLEVLVANLGVSHSVVTWWSFYEIKQTKMSSLYNFHRICNLLLPESV